MRLAAGLCPDPLGELKRSPRPPSRNKGCLLLREGRDREREGRPGERRGGEGRALPLSETFRRLCWRHTDDVYRCLHKEVKKSCRTDKKRWLEDKASEAQAAADNNDPKTLYCIVRELTGARSSSNVPRRQSATDK